MTFQVFHDLYELRRRYPEIVKRWTYFLVGYLLLCLLICFLGYGNITPVTTGGRVLCIFFALFGIPINILFLQLIGERMLRGEKYLVTKFETKCLKREGVPQYLNEKCSFLGVLLLVVLLFACAGIHTATDGWTFFEGFYAFFITFTTVGFGDLIPGTVDGKMEGVNTVIQVTFIVLGLASMSNVINGLVNCSEAGKLFRKLTARCGRRGSVEVTDETKEGGEMELK
ncbi:potassium channel subfamily K member 16-like [Orbicella faveolata]|uniref:potassium channel subfamily K member 16-like n=1 Tax=Orbicella faveolata TaxID=48498 RepID=UPI0009E29022|nr:potassium channel subfamily K member 16-like [Orbicella faveolata]